jgi:dephospho-CoA kinase
MALTVGITGGIGSGKTTVCHVFELLGTPVFEADNVAKKLLNTDEIIKSELVHLFGPDIFNPDGTLNRKKLAGIIFNNPIQLTKMNQLVHPAVRKEFSKWTQQNEDFPYIIHEAAILFESGFYRMMDFTILVSAPEEERIKRVMKRERVSKKEVMERIKHQFSDEKKQKMATFVLENDNKHLLIPEIIKIDKNLKTYGKIW